MACAGSCADNITSGSYLSCECNFSSESSSCRSAVSAVMTGHSQLLVRTTSLLYHCDFGSPQDTRKQEEEDQRCPACRHLIAMPHVLCPSKSDAAANSTAESSRDKLGWCMYHGTHPKRGLVFLAVQMHCSSRSLRLIVVMDNFP